MKRSKEKTSKNLNIKRAYDIEMLGYIIITIVIFLAFILGLSMYIYKYPFNKSQSRYISKYYPKDFQKNVSEKLNSTKENYENLSKKEFCGYSTYGYCETDRDCIQGGCSGQVCASRDEISNLITTCEYRECYNAKEYGLSCRCIENKCQWY